MQDTLSADESHYTSLVKRSYHPHLSSATAAHQPLHNTANPTAQKEKKKVPPLFGL